MKNRFYANECLRHNLVVWCQGLIGMAALTGTLFLAACDNSQSTLVQAVSGGDPEQGVQLIREYGCVSCHTVPGVRGADGTVGPPLTAFARRDLIAGAVPNKTANLLLWIQDPQAIEPNTAMPNLGVSEAEARDIAAYLYTLN